MRICGQNNVVMSSCRNVVMSMGRIRRYVEMSLCRYVDWRRVVMSWGALIAAALLLTSCEYKDLCYDHNHWATVKVTFDWQKAPEAITRADGQQQQGLGMTVLFYNLDEPGAEPIRYDFGLEGGTARLEAGTYRAVCYNNNTETILYRGMNDYSTLEAYTRQSSIEEGTLLTRSGMPRAQGTETEPVILEPDPLWGSCSEPFTLKHDDRDVSLVLYPEHRFQTLTVIITNVPNLQYTGQFGGAMSGLSASRWMAAGFPSEQLATQAFTASIIDATTLQMKFRIFGHCPHLEEGIENQHIFTIYAILADGSKWYYTINVTDKVHEGGSISEQEEELDIAIDGLPVPKPIVNGSGFQPTIDGWQGVEIEVGM